MAKVTALPRRPITSSTDDPFAFVGTNGVDVFTAPTDNNYTIRGLGGDDRLTGAGGNDVIDGGTGNDLMRGGTGDDTYRVDSPSDAVFEVAGQGFDIIYTTANHTLRAGSEVEVLASAAPFGSGGLTLIGNEYNNRIRGDEGANIINGGAGADLLYGFGGNDSYYVDQIGDFVVERAGDGVDTVYASSSYSLRLGDSVEVLGTSAPTGTTAINLSGNEIANTLRGNDGANTLNGAGGDDAMYGFGGNDVYYVDRQGDQVIERANGGFDILYTSVSYRLRPGEQVELIGALRPFETTALDLTGNEWTNRLQGNNGDNVLNGGLGADTLYGFDGQDLFSMRTALGGDNVDTIVDFVSGEDKIGLLGTLFGDIDAGALDPASFRLGTEATAAGDRILYDQEFGRIFYDADGTGGTAAVLFARVDPAMVLAATDFVVI